METQPKTGIDIVTTNTPKDTAEYVARTNLGAKAKRIRGGWKVTFITGKEIHYMNRTEWFRKG